MKSLILRTATGYLLPLLVLYAAYLFVGGHNVPGGGFVGGLMVAAAVSLGMLAFDSAAIESLLPISPQQLIGIGLLLVAAAGLAGPLAGSAFLTGKWTEISMFGGEELFVGTPLLFDLGVFLGVIGVVLTIVTTLFKDEEAA